MIRRAMLLAAGKATRLQPLGLDLPKPLMPIAGKPLVEHTILQLAKIGVSEIVMNLHQRPEVAMAHFGDGSRLGVTMHYSVEREPLGTAGGVRQVLERFKNEPFFVVYGDNLTTCRFDRLAGVHAARGGIGTIALFHKADVGPHSSVTADESDRISAFVEKPAAGAAADPWISAGIFVLECDALAGLVPGRQADFGYDLFPDLVKRGAQLNAYRMSADEGLWWIDTPDAYTRASQLWADGTPRGTMARPAAREA